MDFFTPENFKAELSRPFRDFVKTTDIVLRAIREDEPMTDYERLMIETYLTRLQAELTARRARQVSRRAAKGTEVR